MKSITLNLDESVPYHLTTYKFEVSRSNWFILLLNRLRSKIPSDHSLSFTQTAGIIKFCFPCGGFCPKSRFITSKEIQSLDSQYFVKFFTAWSQSVQSSRMISWILISFGFISCSFMLLYYKHDSAMKTVIQKTEEVIIKLSLKIFLNTYEYTWSFLP